jgi:uncharacterized protein
LDRAAALTVASVLAAWVFVLADATQRTFGSASVSRHVAASFALYAVAGAAVGLAASAIAYPAQLLATRLGGRYPRFAVFAAPAVYAVVAALASTGTAFWTFSGARVRATLLGSVGPWLFVLGIGLVVAGLASLMQYAASKTEAERRWPAVALAVVLALVAVATMLVDLKVYVALYERLHTVLEVAAWACAASAVLIAINLLAARFPRIKGGVRIFAAAALGWFLVVSALTPLREWLGRSLRHTWIDELYVGRALKRLQTVEAFLADPLGFRGLAMSRVDRLQKRYDVPVTRDPAWEKPLAEPPELAAKIHALRGERDDFNIVVFYVDTLRADVAADPRIMPATVNFGKRALNFRQAYSAGSDTLRALPALTGGSYSVGVEPPPGDLLRVLRKNETLGVLFIAQSAYEFLAKLHPAFKFEKTVQIPDYPPEKTDVWGYGADGPTAGRIVDEALGWMKNQKNKRFFAWLFHFDQHNWRELDSEYVHVAAKKYTVPDSGGLNWRYRVVARAIDAEFQRLLKGLNDAGLADRTVVLFVSDHGEALGRDGFWVHSVFLWESLVRVPLILRVPGIPPRQIEERVSLVDVAPTLARYIQRDAPMLGYHGEDLVSYATPKRPPRRLPILMAAASKDQLARVGLIPADQSHKLVFSFESGLPELYDLRSSDPDIVSVAEQDPALTLRMLSTLARTPVFPRTITDLRTREALSITTGGQ